MTTAVTSTEILRHTTAFLSDVISNSDLRHRLISVLQNDTSSSPIPDETAAKLAGDTLETAISFSSTTSRSFSLSLAENLLLPLPNHHHPLPSFLLSLIRTLRNRHHEAAISLLRIFRCNPSLARSAIAPVLYDRLFSVHLVALFRWLLDRRAQILSTSSSSGSCYSLSNVNEEQASKLRELEREYEEILDKNCRVVAEYFEEVLVSGDGNVTVSPPELMLNNGEDGGRTERTKEGEEVEETQTTTLNYNNPIWTEASFEFLVSGSCSNSSYITFYPQRVSPTILKPQESSQNSPPETESSLNENLTCSSSESEVETDIIATTKRTTNPITTENKSLLSPTILKPQKSSNNLKARSSLDNNLPCSPSDSEAENEEKEGLAQLEPQQSQTLEQTKNTFARSMSFPDYNTEDYSSPLQSEKQEPPKDFVCPLTSNMFDDPVTLETGQTFERQAIEEWFNKGNATCPVTRQKLQKTRIPKTNHVLKQLVSRWKEQNPNSSVSPSCEIPYEDTKQELQEVIPSSSPNSTVISDGTFDGKVRELSDAINNLCKSEMLEESSRAVLQIEKIWRELSQGVDIHIMLSKPSIVNRFMEILFNSVSTQVLGAVVFLLAEMSSRDNAVIQMLTQVDTGVEHIMSLFKKGLKESVVLIYHLKPSRNSLVDAAIVEGLVEVANVKEEEMLEMCLKPKTAAVILLAQIIGRSEEKIASSVAKTVLSGKEIGTIVGSLGAEWAEERVAAVEILLKCIQEDGTCRNIIAEKVQLSAVLECFIGATEGEHFKIVQFFSELVKLNRRTFNEQILRTIKEEGPLSTMHSLLIYLQTAHQDQFPILAGFLLQLDLLVEPTKMSIYSEEAIDTLISCLRNTHYPSVQLAAAETILSLQGRFNFTGMPLTREVLLERAGLDRSYETSSHMDEISNFSEGIEASIKEEKSADEWERKVASVLVSHDCGLLFEALADGLKSQNAKLRSACFVSATWLVYMLTVLPDTGIQGAARVFFLEHFISTLKSAKDTEDRILSMLALKSFLHFDDGLRDLTSNAKDILKGLRELEGLSQMASEIMKVLVEEEPESKADIWIHKELIQVDCKENGEVLSVICFEDKIFSGHSDGTIRVWRLNDSLIHFLQKTKEHMKDVTSLSISESGETLYSGSLDRTVKVWSVGKASIHLVQEHDMKDQIHNLVLTNSVSCYIPHGTGIKVKSWNGESKLLNSNKHVKCLALVNGRLYSGCHDASIQEIDLATGIVRTIQSGSKNLLGKANPILALQVHGEFIYAASSSSDGSVIKVWNTSTYSMVGSMKIALEMRAMAVSSELIYLGCKGGAVEIWGRKKHNRVDTLHSRANCKVLCMALNSNEDILVVGTSDGLIQAWGVK